MSKLLLSLLLLVVVTALCIEGRPGHRLRSRGRGHRRHGRGMMDRIGRLDHSGINPRRARRWMSRFMPRRLGFGIGPYDSSWFDVDFSFGFVGEEDPWWEGPNVCVRRTEDNVTADGDVRHHNFMRTESCDVSETAFTCTSTIRRRGESMTVKKVYECCLGFTRKEGNFGCPKEITIKDLEQTAVDLGLNEFINAIKSVNLHNDLKEGNFTIFAPTDAAFNELGLKLPAASGGISLQDMNSVVMVSKSLSDELVDDFSDLLLGHVSTDIFTSSRLSDEQLIETASPFKSKIRINIYDTREKIVTANCRKVVSMDNIANNSVIHVVDRVLQPVTDSLLNIVTRNPNLNYIKTAIGRTEFSRILGDDGQLTLFAPTDAAFRKLDPTRRQKLLSDSKCLGQILKNHVLPNVICSPVIQGRARTVNLLDRYLHLSRDEDDKLFVEKSQILSKDIMATNGVIYLIDDVLIPDEALEVLDVVEKQNASRVLQLIKDANLEKALKTTENITFFVPVDDAFQQLDPTVLSSLASDDAALTDVLTYHVGSSVESCSTFSNNFKISTLNPGKEIRINEYSSFPFGREWTRTAQCARIIKSDVKACNGMIHFIDKVLMPPSGNIVDVLALDSRFSYLVELVKKAGLADQLQEGLFTVFAPTNEVLEEDIEMLREMADENTAKLKKLLSTHIAPGVVCCAAVPRDHWFHHYSVRTISREKLRLANNAGNIQVQNAEISQCDLSATNGVIHVINNVIRGEKLADIFLTWTCGQT